VKYFSNFPLAAGPGGFFVCQKCREIKQRQKIAACGSSYIGMCSPVGAAEGCDLLTLIFTNPKTKTANPKVSRCCVLSLFIVLCE
jgi:hypothetical protein